MNSSELWPFFFEINILSRSTGRERTLFVTLFENGDTCWVDHSGRMRHAGVGMLSFENGKLKQFRGGREISEAQAEQEKAEFTITIATAPHCFEPIKGLILEVGRSWLSGWPSTQSVQLHGLLEIVYWNQVNQFVHEPFIE